MNNITLSIIACGIIFYLYFLPKILIYSYIDSYIEKKFNKYTKNYSETEEVKKNIYGITGFMSFLSGIGGIFISVISDKKFIWNAWYKFGTIIFLLIIFLILTQYYNKSLRISSITKVIEILTILLALIFIVINIYIRGLL
jgi:VIT1/CCC1 family predicted Fe2+/Mn2+ transporter